MQRAGLGLLLRSRTLALPSLRQLPSAVNSPLLRGSQQQQRRWNQQAPAESHIFDEHDARRRQLLYRSKQRGWLEMDIMLGSWVRELFSIVRYVAESSSAPYHVDAILCCDKR